MNNFVYLIFGLFIALSIQHFFIFVGRRKELSNLSFSILCISFSILLFSYRIYPLLNNYNIFIQRIMAIQSIVFASFSIMFFAHTTFDLSRIKNLSIIIFFILLFWGLFDNITLLANKKTMLVNNIFYFISIMSLMFFIFLVVKEFVILKQYKSLTNKLLLSGYIATAFFSIFSLFFLMNNIYISYIIPYIGFIFMIFIFSFALANTFNQEHRDIIDLKNTLEQKVIDRTKELSESKAEVEILSQQKTDFFVNVSHEIRTPLTLLKCSIDKYINKIDDKKGDDLQIIVKSYNKLERDVLNFFDIERFNIGKQVYDNSKTSNFSIILKENLHLFSELFISNKITIKTNIENNIIIEIDPQGLDRIIYNIIDNAIKYNRECGTIEITLKKNNDNIIFIVKDNGIGIKEEQQKYIFEPYYQASHPKNNYQGIGVGLSIVKRIVDSVNANIEIYSKQNECTEIKIIFNKYLEKPETKIEVVEHKEIISYIDSRELIKINENGKQYTLLIVEDNLDTLAMLIISFRDNYNVYPAKSGLEALNMLENMIKTPSVIISDIMMDNMDGVEFLNKLKQREEYKDIPVIFLTAKDMQQQKLSGLKQGAIDYITKPFSMDEIKAKVETHTKNRELTIDKIADNIINQATKMKQSKMSKENQQKITFDEKCKIYNLSDKEKEIVHYIIQGKATKEISSILNIGEKAISSRLTSIYNKTNTTGRIELSNLF